METTRENIPQAGDEMISGDEIPWVLTPIDPLTIDDGHRWLADTLRASLEHVRALSVRCDRYQNRVQALLSELREARADAQDARTQLRAWQQRAA